MLVGTMMHTHRCIRCITMGYTDINNICTCLYVTFLHFSPFHVFLSVSLRVSPCFSMSLHVSPCVSLPGPKMPFTPNSYNSS